MLAKRQGAVSEDLQLHNDGLDTSLPNPRFASLAKLQCNDLDPDYIGWAIPDVIVADHKTMRHLKLGFERSFAWKSPLFSHSYVRAISAASELLYNRINLNLQAIELPKSGGKVLDVWLCLESLHLICIEITAKSLPIFDFNNLSSLRLESCISISGTFSLLNAHGSERASQWVPKLKTFHLRYEVSTTSFHANLKDFLMSFSGLVHLSLLLEGPDPVTTLTPFLQNHGATLRTLVWDQRSEPRDSMSQPTDNLTISNENYASEIAECCPNLRELGLVTSWISNDQSRVSCSIDPSRKFDN